MEKDEDVNRMNVLNRFCWFIFGNLKSTLHTLFVWRGCTHNKLVSHLSVKYTIFWITVLHSTPRV